MNDKLQLNNTYLKTVSIIHLALLIGQAMFATVVFIQSGSTKIVFNDASDSYFFIVIGLAVGGFAASNFLFKQNLNKANEQTDIKSKLAKYQSALIIRYALLEGPSLFGIVVYLLTGNLFYLIVSIVIMLYFLSLMPTKEKIKEELQLSYDEAAVL